MKLNIKVHSGPESRDHLLELPPGANASKATQGRLRFVLDGESQEADWAEISPGVYSIIIGSGSYEAYVTRLPGESPAQAGPYRVTVGKWHYLVEVSDRRLQRYTTAAISTEDAQEIHAPMPGRIVKILVRENQQVSLGEGLLVIEAMKMQNELRAPRSARVARIYVQEGTGVETGVKLVRLV